MVLFADARRVASSRESRSNNGLAGLAAQLDFITLGAIILGVWKGRSVRVFLTKRFARFARSERVSDERLCEAISRAEEGLIDADLGGGLIKQRVARPGQGRSGGYRTVVAFRRLGRAVFLYGFAKNERDNIDDDDLARLKKLAAVYLGAPFVDLERWCDEGELKEIECDDEEEVSEQDR